MPEYNVFCNKNMLSRCGNSFYHLFFCHWLFLSWSQFLQRLNNVRPPEWLPSINLTNCEFNLPYNAKQFGKKYFLSFFIDQIFSWKKFIVLQLSILYITTSMALLMNKKLFSLLLHCNSIFKLTWIKISSHWLIIFCVFCLMNGVPIIVGQVLHEIKTCSLIIVPKWLEASLVFSNPKGNKGR